MDKFEYDQIRRANKLQKIIEQLGDTQDEILGSICQDYIDSKDVEILKELLTIIPPGFWRSEVRGILKSLEKLD